MNATMEAPAGGWLMAQEMAGAPRCAQDGYVARLIDASSDDEVWAYQQLRYECFVLRKGWVETNPSQPGRETDGYDPYCYHLGVFQGPLLVAYLRVLPWQADPGFMLEHEFGDLSPEAVKLDLAQAGNVELSRLVVALPPGSGRGETLAMAELLFKLVYHLGRRLGWQAYYIVLEEAWLRILNRHFGLAFAPLGEPHVYPDGTRTVAACAGCGTLEQAVRQSSPDKYRWYQQQAVS